jgi:hypothetical protein
MSPDDSETTSETDPTPAGGPATPPGTGLAEIRYSLPALLAELKDERAAGSFAMEKLHQAEIGKLFQARKKRRVKKP